MLGFPALIVWVSAWVIVQSEVCPYPPLAGSNGCIGDGKPCVNGVCTPQKAPVGSWLVEVCECLEGWTGPACDVCCDLPCEHGQCEGSSKTDLHCVCDIGYTSENCNTSTEQKTTRSACSSHRSPVQCGTNQCYNGNCTGMEIVPGVTLDICACDPDWKGVSCDLCCDLPCVHGVCNAAIGTQQTYCSCSPGYTGSLCETSIGLFPWPLPTFSSSARPPRECNATARNKTDMCIGISCYNGVCERRHMNVSGRLIEVGQCVCDGGWKGHACDLCCDLPCKHGECFVAYGTGQPQCSCTAGYTGPLCDTVKGMSDLSTASGTAVSPRGCNATTRNETDTCIGISCYNGFCERGHQNISGKLIEVAHCVCDQGWTGYRCDNCCDIPCVYGVCDIEFETKEMYCNCYSNYTGKLCDRPKPIPTLSSTDYNTDQVFPIWVWAVLSVAALLVLTLAVSVGIGLHLLRTRPYRLPKTILRMVHHLSNESEYKEYDAFVSYRSSHDDQTFVVRQLMKKLEGEMRYKICFHAKDFLAGRTIAENIIDAVEKSRRTILVISPDFLHPGWPMYECEVALYEMLKHKHRIIPIIFKDISSVKDINPVIKQILNSITYLRWPGHENRKEETKFWADLRLSMPRLTHADKETTPLKKHDQGRKRKSVPPTGISRV